MVTRGDAADGAERRPYPRQENRMLIEVRVLSGERARGSRAPTEELRARGCGQGPRQLKTE